MNSVLQNVKNIVNCHVVAIIGAQVLYIVLRGFVNIFRVVLYLARIIYARFVFPAFSLNACPLFS